VLMRRLAGELSTLQRNWNIGTRPRNSQCAGDAKD